MKNFSMEKMNDEKLSNRELVDLHIANLSKEIRPSVEYLRGVILSIDKDISEHIKWNSPAFFYSGEMQEFEPREYRRDLLVCNLRKDKILCVLPTGMIIKNHLEILEGDYKDGRRMISFTDLEDIKRKEKVFRDTIKEWLSLIEK